MVTRIVRLAWLCASLALSSLPAAAQNTVPQADWISALRDGGYVIVFRHGATHPDQADTDPLNTDNVAKQRQLNGRWPRARKIDWRIPAQAQDSRWPSLHQPVQTRDRYRRADGFWRREGVRRLHRGRARGDTHREQPARSSATQGGRYDAARQHQHHRGHAQAEHPGRFRQGLVRCPRRRSLGVQAGRQWRLQDGWPDPGRRLGQARPRQLKIFSRDLSMSEA
jgi:hypothetical protein